MFSASRYPFKEHKFYTELFPRMSELESEGDSGMVEEDETGMESEDDIRKVQLSI